MSEFDKNKYSKKATTPPFLPPSVKNNERLKQEKALEKLEKEKQEKLKKYKKKKRKTKSNLT